MVSLDSSSPLKLTSLDDSLRDSPMNHPDDECDATSPESPSTASSPTPSSDDETKQVEDDPVVISLPPTPEGSSPTRSSPPSHKLRRKAPLEAPFVESTAIQRLVEYFIVVTSRPRWENQSRIRRPSTNSSESPSSTPARKTLTDPAESPRHHRGKGFQEEKSSKASPGSRDDVTEEEIDFTFQPVITARYPLQEYKDNPLNPMILQFCFPTGDVIHPTKQYELPRIHYFVLTNDKGRKVYGTCLTIFEEFYLTPESPLKQANLDDSSRSDAIEVSVEDESKIVFIPKVLCLLSTWPYLTAFREYLAQLYRLATASNVMTAPIERYVVNLCTEIPAPPPGAYEIQVPILDSIIRFWAPPAKLPIAYVALPYHILFECLDLDHLLDVWAGLILEQKLVLISSQYSILTICSEILCSLLFPMKWSHLYIPLLPRMLSPMLDAPVPYICGVVRDNWAYAKEYLSTDAIVVDLDQNRVTIGNDTPIMPAPPSKKWAKLLFTLQNALGDIFEKAHDLQGNIKNSYAPNKKNSPPRNMAKMRELRDGPAWKERLNRWDSAFNLAFTPDSKLMDNDVNESVAFGGNDGQTQWDKVQEAFLRFFVALFKNYRKFLVVPKKRDANSRPSFQTEKFLAAQTPGNVAFMEVLCQTQQFDDFITRRMYSPGEPELVFFDQSIDAKLNRSKLKIKKVDTPFLQSANAHKILTRMKAIEPNEEGLSKFHFERFVNPYVYRTWPDKLDQSLFSTPRPIPKMIAAEFDRQALLVSRLRAERVGDEDDEAEFFGGDYDPSPEVASYTVFFFVYSALVGLQWQEFQDKQKANSEVTLSVADKSKEAEPPSEKIEAVLPSIIDKKLADSCASDLTLGFCNNCSEAGLTFVNSTLVYVSTEAEDAYSALFNEATHKVFELQRQMKTDSACPVNAEEVDHEAEGVAALEEAREVATAQLDLAFEALQALSTQGLLADLDAFKSLMEACGRCGDTQRALGLMELMKKDGFVLDAEILSCFVAAFATDEADMGALSTSRTSQSTIATGNQDAYSSYLRRGIDELKGTEDRPWLFHEGESSSNDEESNSMASSHSTEVTNNRQGAFFDWFSGTDPIKRKRSDRRRRKRRYKGSHVEHPTSTMIATQIELGNTLLDLLYPNLQINTSQQACPHCSSVMSEDDIVRGWSPCSFEDFTTHCNKCKHRFVPHFCVSCSSETFMGSQGPGSALFCEFLSPWVVRKALHHVIKGDVGIMGMLDPSWRSGTDIRATLYWNIIVLCRRYQLPFTFLLEGSVQGRLILPRRPAHMD